MSLDELMTTVDLPLIDSLIDYDDLYAEIELTRPVTNARFSPKQMPCGSLIVARDLDDEIPF